ncbi:N-acetylmuramoyl-L-alanine amidase [Streptomyces sp. NPDC101116]|uniref:N-acetylmuramoyl-L-alanine amidase n=1 Tax=Streptomyces sp. NPDC101116 TaxID=3366107 RepID=UPI003828E0C7
MTDDGIGVDTYAYRGRQHFSAVMMTWEDPRAQMPGTPEIRTHSARSGSWSPWTRLSAEPLAADWAEGRHPGARGGTASVWAGESDGFDIRVVRGDGTITKDLPRGTAVRLLDPGDDPEPTAQLGTTFKAGKPPIIPQARWGATARHNGKPRYGSTVKAVIIHHTGVNSDNKVSCARSRARMRTIQQEHLARGYYDVGYNFVVDRCGQIFEGRSGGSGRPVLGAHDVGFNTNTVGIAYLGNTMTARPTRAALRAIARLVAWKLGRYGVGPVGRVRLVSGSGKGVDGNKVPQGKAVTLPRVFGHRHTNATDCPGRHLYRQLPALARLAESLGRPHAARPSTTP